MPSPRDRRRRQARYGVQNMYAIRQADLAPSGMPAQALVRFALPPEVGDGFHQHCAVEPDLQILETRYRPRRDFAYDSVMGTDKPVLVMTFGIEGDSAFVSASGKELPYRKGYTTVTTFRQSTGQRRYRASGTTHQLRLLVGEAWLTSQLGEETARSLFRSDRVDVLACRPTSALAAGSLRTLIRLQTGGAQANLLRKGLAVTALASELSWVESVAEPPPDPGLTSRDIQCLHAARDFLRNEMAAPPSMRDLARRAGINEKKLSSGFRATFGMTPHDWLIDLRMRTSWNLLQETRCQVAEAGFAVGYRFPGNFSAAFTRFFGVTPKQARRAILPNPSHQ